MPCRTPGMPLVIAAPPAASTPTSRAPVSTKPAKVPAALDPPPMHATTTSGSEPSSSVAALLVRLVPDDPLELAHHVGERMRPHHRPEAVVRRLDRGYPLAHRLVHRVLEGPAARGDRADLRAEQLHAEDVELLALGVHLAHEDGALQPEQRRGRCRGHAVLASAGLGDHARSCPSAVVSSAWPTTLFSLCEPVWARSSRFSSTRTPRRSESRGTR